MNFATIALGTLIALNTNAPGLVQILGIAVAWIGAVNLIRKERTYGQ